ncbi:LuxR C-terminal-related transcriptional regulator [Streptomyces sp. NEAU-Y11]|uniref:LuxR C-terminal-related transcriptional regulator n=1 Tax=Streptomyces cucumeris TaxID=2962890 RepID=UPI0020C937F1|nr:LuxR C-terminal-related transcriptional regulator [Streptomyces sp. NEAU-Y11]MCP9212566.1 LuxR C-terminal-related transcriptional regulator [Streptomyces sp. NEAU-Y11]
MTSAVRAAASPIPTGSAPGPLGPVVSDRPSLAGRERELALALGALNGGSGGVWITGGPGVGKTRLAQEITTMVTRVEWITPVETPEEVSRLLRHHPRGPRVVCVDDAPQLSREGVDALLLLAARATVKLLVTGDTERVDPRLHTLWKDQRLSRLELAPLDAVGARRLAGTMTGDRLTRSSVIRFAAMSAGNPLLLREVLRAAIGQGLLSRQGAHWHLADDTVPVSGALRDLVAQDLDALSEVRRDALQLIALAEPARLEVLEDVVGVPALLALEDQGLIRAVGGHGAEAVRPVSTVTVRHPYLGHVLRQEAAALRSRHWLDTWAAALQARGDARPAEWVTVARWQLDTGCVPVEPVLLDATRYALRAYELPVAARLARAAWHTYRTPDAAGLLGRVLLAEAEFEALRRLAAEAQALPGGKDIRARLDPLVARALILQGRYREAELLTARLPEEQREAAEGLAAYFRGRFRSTPTEVPPQVRRSPARTTEATLLAMATLCRQGRPLDALDLHHELFGTGSADHCDRGWMDEMYSMALLYAGRLEEAESLLTRAYREATEGHRVRVDAQRGLALGWALHERGRLHEALPYVSFTPAYQVGWQAWQDQALICAALVRGGLPAVPGRAGTASAEDALRDVEPGPHATALAVARARTAHRDGDQVAAARLLEGAVEVALGEAAYGDAVMALHEGARLGVEPHTAVRDDLPVQGPYLHARLHYARAVSAGDERMLSRVCRTLAECGAQLYAAEGYAELARLQRRAGRARAATAATTQARTLLRGCGEVITPPLYFLGEGPTLSPRERTVAALAARGLTDKEIAARLVVSPRTVGNTLYRVYQKLGVGDRRELSALLPA